MRTRLRQPGGSLAVSGIPALLSGAALFIGIIALFGYRTHSLVTPAGPIEDPALWGMEDFRTVVYFPVRAMLEGVNPYHSSRFIAAYPTEEPFGLYSPAVLLVHLPFGLLPRGPAHLAFFLWSAALIPVLALLLLRIVSIDATPARVLWVAAFIAAGRPVYMMLTLGQVALIFVIGVVLALHYAASRPVLSGFGLSLAMLKPTFGVPLMVLMLARRDVRAVLTGVSISAVAAAIPTLVLFGGGGVDGLVAVIRDNLSVYTGESVNRLDAASWGRIDAAVAATRVFALPITRWLPVVLGVGIVGISALKISRLPKADTDLDGASLASLIACLAIIAGVYHQTYDGTLLALPLVVLGLARHPPLSGAWRAAGLLLLLGVWFNYVSTNTALARLGFEPWTWPWRLATSASSLAIGIVLLIALFGGPVAGKDE